MTLVIHTRQPCFREQNCTGVPFVAISSENTESKQRRSRQPAARGPGLQMKCRPDFANRPSGDPMRGYVSKRNFTLKARCSDQGYLAVQGALLGPQFKRGSSIEPSGLTLLLGLCPLCISCVLRDLLHFFLA